MTQGGAGVNWAWDLANPVEAAMGRKRSFNHRIVLALLDFHSACLGLRNGPYSYEPEFEKGMDYGNNGKSRFLGVYSGRLVGEDEKDLQLGMVWSLLYIDRIVKGQRLEGEAPVQWPPV